MNLKQWRTEMGYTQAKAAECLGMARRNYCQLEGGINYHTGKPVSVDRRTELACLYLIEHKT